MLIRCDKPKSQKNNFVQFMYIIYIKLCKNIKAKCKKLQPFLLKMSQAHWMSKQLIVADYTLWAYL